MAQLTLATSDAGDTLGGGGGYSPANNPATQGGTQIIPWQGTQPVLYPAPVTPNQPGTATGTPTAAVPAQPPDNCLTCGAAPSTTAGPGATAQPITTTQPVLKVATETAGQQPCEVCLWLRARPWWWWLIVVGILLLIYRKGS